jgi:hypothetical protein
MGFARPVLRQVALAAIAVYAVTTTFELLLPAHLSTDHVSWLVEPWFGAYVYTFDPASLSYVALSIGLAGLFVISIAIYLDHCVVDQPLWAIVGGWGPLVAGMTLTLLENALGTWWVNVDVDHHGFQLAWCELSVGAAVVAASWLHAPELFNPRIGRIWIVMTVAAIFALPMASAIGGSETFWALASPVVLVAVLLLGVRVRPRTAAASGRGTSSSEHDTSAVDSIQQEKAPPTRVG